MSKKPSPLKGSSASMLKTTFSRVAFSAADVPIIRGLKSITNI